MPNLLLFKYISTDNSYLFFYVYYAVLYLNLFTLKYIKVFKKNNIIELLTWRHWHTKKTAY